ncbi:MAG: NusG domain II-containing protein [Candidatus Latescibacteria bacterium]|nr:NusG domain II-containing protein [Candidatus Latescibacterota bacterium]
MLTLSDKILIGALLLLSGLSFLALAAFRGAGQTLVVEQDGKVLARRSIADEDTLRIPGPLGVTTIRIAEGRARVLNAPCPQQLCVKTGAISKAGAMVVCVPNRVVVRIEGPSKDGVDAVTR